MEPLGESFSDYEIVCKIAERLGLLEEYTGGRSPAELMRHGFETSGAQELISWEELNDKGYVVVPTDPDWESVRAGLIDFYEDPAGNPLSTATGKIEFYATGLAEHFPDDDERPPVPKWIPGGETHQERWGPSAPRPIRCWWCPTIRAGACTRSTTTSAGCGRSRPARCAGPTAISTSRSGSIRAMRSERGIEHGDVVSIYNERGAGAGRGVRDRADSARAR